MASAEDVSPECPSLLRALIDAPEEISIRAPAEAPAISAPNFPPVILSVPATLRLAAAYPDGYVGAAELGGLLYGHSVCGIDFCRLLLSFPVGAGEEV